MPNVTSPTIHRHLTIVLSLFLITLADIAQAQQALPSGNTYTLFTVDQDRLNRSPLAAFELSREQIHVGLPAMQETDPLHLDDRLTFSMSGDVVELHVSRTDRHRPGTFSFQARSQQSDWIATLTQTENGLAGRLVDVTRGRLFHITMDPNDGRQQLSQIRQEGADILACADDEEHEHLHEHSLPKGVVPSLAISGGSRRKVSGSSPALSESLLGPTVSSMADAIEDTTTLDLLMVYSKAAEDWAKTCFPGSSSGCTGLGNIDAYLAQSVNLSQTALDNSLMPVKIRLVHAYRTNYDELNDNIGSGERLRRLTASSTYPPASWGWNDAGHMDEVHALREEYGADFVAAVLDISDVGGIAWRLTTPSGWRELAFSINRVKQLVSDFVLIHEMGHNFGNDHSRNQNSNAANSLGGVFQYSVGYRWSTGEPGLGHSTVMGYLESSGYSYAPMFSSPLLSWNGMKAGVELEKYNPADARRSNLELKTVLASYSPTKVDPPVLAVNQTDVVESMDREDRRTVEIPISNTGSSDLMWSLDIPLQQAFEKSRAKEVFSTLFEEPNKLTGANRPLLAKSGAALAASPTAVSFTGANAQGMILEEGFETFGRGSYRAVRGWKSNSESKNFVISGSNPKTGTVHLRTTAGSDSYWYILSPFLGPQATGEFTISMDVSISADANTGQSNYFDVAFYDVKTGGITSSFAVDAQRRFQIYTTEGAVPGTAEYVTTARRFTYDRYTNIKVVYNLSERKIDYLVDDRLVQSTPYLFGTTADYFVLYFEGGSSPNSRVDVDNVTIQRPWALPWMDVASYSGTVRPGGTDTLKIDLSTVGVEAGEYSATLALSTNDPGNEAVPITVGLSVSTAVGTAPDPAVGLPDQFTLSQNYPNPFNPTTTLQYALPEAASVRLAVYSILGQEVAVLDQGPRAAGTHSVYVDASSWSSGIYVYRLEAAGRVLTRRMVLLK